MRQSISIETETPCSGPILWNRAKHSRASLGKTNQPKHAVGRLAIFRGSVRSNPAAVYLSSHTSFHTSFHKENVS